jgi:hypothetical protein
VLFVDHNQADALERANTAERVPTTTSMSARRIRCHLIVALAVREAAVLNRDAVAERLAEE